jgi:hypothetical protein
MTLEKLITKIVVEQLFRNKFELDPEHVNKSMYFPLKQEVGDGLTYLRETIDRRVSKAPEHARAALREQLEHVLEHRYIAPAKQLILENEHGH